MIVIGGKCYELMVNHKEGWNPEGFRGRYSEVLDRYDYIVGDWGYSQLRLKGFYRDNHPKANRDSSISGLVDYINEYCNFGCAYFVLRKMKDAPKDPNAKDILIKEPGEGSKEALKEASKEALGKEAVPQGAAAKEAALPQISSRRFQAESAVSREHSPRDNAPRERTAKDRGRDNRNNKDYQSRKNGRDHQARDNHGKDNQRDNPNRDNPSRDRQPKENQTRAKSPREQHPPREQQPSEDQIRAIQQKPPQGQDGQS